MGGQWLQTGRGAVIPKKVARNMEGDQEQYALVYKGAIGNGT
jgi:hypothetical protein